ncbi:MAG: sensor signal transduction histidine kinase [Nocardioides sp.]|nr:sensor signal transduction histidine kinase [Nocardioides sp.]
MAALLLVMSVCGALAVQGAPAGGRAMGIWPVGLASGVLIYARGRRVPALTALILVIAVATIWLGGRPFDVAVGYGVGVAAEVWVVWRVFTRGRREKPSLQTDRDLLRLVAAVGLGGLVVAALAALTSVVTGFGHPPLVALTIATAHVASQLTLLPFFSEVHQNPSVAPTWERLAQWVLIVTVTPLVFYPSHFPSLVFLAIPLLGWGALRNRPWEALVQLMAVLFFAVVMTTYGLGPFSSISKDLNLPVDVRGTVLGAFAVACALVVVPLIITVGQQLENAHEAAAERDKVQNIVNSTSGVAIIGTDERGRITLFNPGAERLLGYTRGEVLGHTTRFLHSARGIAAQAKELGVANDFATVARAMANPTAAGRDMGFLTKDGEERTHSMTLTRMVDDRGRVTGYVSTSEDVTERVHAQTALEEALETERRAVERLQSVDQVKDAFVSSVSHELRTPITSIVGYLEMLSEGSFGDLNGHQADAVRRVSDNSSRLLALIDDLLTLSRVQDDGMTLADRAFDLREVVRSGYGVVSPAWAGRDLEVSAELPEEPVPFVGDKDMIERVVVNLVGNAVKFTPDGGGIEVRMTVDGDHALIDVCDSGIGIPEEEQAQLFSRFFRSSVAQKRAIPGSGLGLSISKAVVEKHGGTISLTSSGEQGTTFRVRLPIVV